MRPWLAIVTGESPFWRDSDSSQAATLRSTDGRSGSGRAAITPAAARWRTKRSPRVAVAVAIVPGEPGDRPGVHRLEADARPYDPRQEMPDRPAMDRHRDRRQPHGLEMPYVIIEQLLVRTGIQQAPSADPP